MTKINMRLFSMELQISLDDLIKRFLEIGIVKTELDVVSSIERDNLLRYLNRNKNNNKLNKLILQRKVCSTLNIFSVSGKNKQVQIEVRKKRTYLKRVIDKLDTSAVVTTFKENNSFLISSKNDCNTGLCNREKLINNEKKDSIFGNVLEKKNIKMDKDAIRNFKSYYNKKTAQSALHFSMQKEKEQVINNNVQKDTIKNNDDFWKNLKLSNSSSVKVEKDSKFIVCTESSIKKDDNSNCKKIENDRRRNSRVYFKYRITEDKSIKRKKRNNSHHHLYNDATVLVDSEKEERLPVSDRINKNKRKQSTLIHNFNKPIQAVVRDIVIGDTITVAELASKMSMKSAYVIKVMMKLGLMATVNQSLDQESAQLVVEEIGHRVILRCSNELESSIMYDRDMMNAVSKVNNDNALRNRAPIVTVVGHVDHGKTSLLDYIRNTKMVSCELGGITQRIGAYHVHTGNGEMITFLDTPGHAAFTAMRIRGMKLTDIVVLVVAVDDGVMPQTIEVIQYIKAYNVPVVVAINKVDKLEFNNIDKIKNELSNYGLVPEEWGGDVQFVQVSAISGAGIDNLLDAILLQSEMLELKVMHCGMASAVVIDSFIDKGRGTVVVALVCEGILKCGDIVLCGTEYGRIRAMRDECGRSITEAGPSSPVELLGLSGIPDSGSMAVVVRDERKAREVALLRQRKCREVKIARKWVTDTENVFSNMQNNIAENENAEFNIVIKADTVSFIEVIRDSLLNLSKGKVKLKILLASIGEITETDVVLASESRAVIIGFNVKADVLARRLIELEQLEIRYYSVIYDLLYFVEQRIDKILTLENKYKVIGLAKVQDVFLVSKQGKVAGCTVIEGSVKRYKKVRVIRDNIVVHNGELESLRRFKSDVNEVSNGMECGISIKNYNDISPGDSIEVLDIANITSIRSESH